MNLFQITSGTAALFVLSTVVSAQISITAGSTEFTSVFDSWGSPYTAGGAVTSVVSGFVASGAAASYRGSSASTTGGVYDIAGFNYQPSSSATSLVLTGTWTNNTGLTITALAIDYSAFVQVDRDSRTPGWTVSTTGLGDPDVSDLNWISTDGPSTPSVTLSGLTLENGSSFSIIWSSDRGAGSGSSPMIGLNNVGVTATVIPEPSTYTALAGFFTLSMVLLRRRHKGSVNL